MASTDQKKMKQQFTGRDGGWKKPKHVAAGVKKKKKWTPENKVFQGSVKEGQGFAFKRKEKVRHEYNKLLRKERRKNNNESMSLYKEEYPEHLKHLYMAEAEKLKQEAWTNRVNRRKLRMKGQEKGGEGSEIGESEAAAQQTETADPETEVISGFEQRDSVSGDPESAITNITTTAGTSDSLPLSNRMKKKIQRKTSFQKTKEEFECVQEKRRNKKMEYLKNKQQREEAIEKYKQKKLETFQMLSKKTKKGQPNLNLQMDYLLQKIMRTDK